MADILVKHLKKKGEEHSSLAMLVNQWGFDEKLIPKALQNVGSLFPHYSRHDESHSKQILVNIERLLGNNIDLLTATDTWLLLEAAYLHDIGMVVPQDHLEEAVCAPGFAHYLDEIIASPHHELNRFASSFNVHDASKCFSGAETPLKAIEKFRQLMAEWFRRQHAGRASSIVQTPWETIGVSSPRTELIPMRLFRVLGKICHMHGAPFEDLFKADGLPFREAGLAQEDCHPRFVACLLRMGDLLDMDDNRFCPVMQRIAGNDRPGLSKAHEDKHAGIRHFRLDQERIEVTAECDTIEGYVETFKWFDWLKKEVQDQMANWRDIVPDRALGLLPTLGDISVRLKGNLQVLRAGQRPQFAVDGTKAIELLQGSNLYNSKFACIRELLQNAVDATLLKIWLDNFQESGGEEWSKPSGRLSKEYFNKHPISVDLRVLPDVPPSDSSKVVWCLKISDSGTGISRADLEFMLRIGGSQKNAFRQGLIKKMPEWMKPSGEFGIGLQSAFLISNKLSLKTKSIFNNEVLNVDLFSPLGNKAGAVTIEALSGSAQRRSGTSIEIQFELDAFSRKWSYDPFRRESIASRFSECLDPILDKKFPFEAAALADKIATFSKGSLIPICANFFTEDESFVICQDSSSMVADICGKEENFSIVDGKELFFSYQARMDRRSGNMDARYRGQTFECKDIGLPYVDIEINLMSGKAGSWLNASRDNLASAAYEDFSALVKHALMKFVDQDLKKGGVANELVLSYFLEHMAVYFGADWRGLADKLRGKWLSLKMEGGKDSYKEIFERDKFVVKLKAYSMPGYDIKESFPCDMEIEGVALLQIMVRAWYDIYGGSVKIFDITELSKDAADSASGEISRVDDFVGEPAHSLNNLFYVFSKSGEKFYSDAAFATALIVKVKEGVGNQRFLVPNIWNKWKCLTLKSDIKIKARPLFSIGFDVGYILLPYLFVKWNGKMGSQVQCSLQQLDMLSKWVIENSALSEEIAFADVRNAYKELIEYIDGSLMNNSRYAASWRAYRKVVD